MEDEFLGKKLFKIHIKMIIIQKWLMVCFVISPYYLIENDGVILGIVLSFMPFSVMYFKKFEIIKIEKF